MFSIFSFSLIKLGITLLSVVVRVHLHYTEIYLRGMRSGLRYTFPTATSSMTKLQIFFAFCIKIPKDLLTLHKEVV